jgi:hypothetical protein
MSDVRFIVLNVSAFSSGSSYDHGDLTVPNSWQDAWVQIECAWSDAHDHLSNDGDCLSIVLVWEWQGRRYVFHTACGLQIWEACAENAEAFRLWAIMSASPID